MKSSLLTLFSLVSLTVWFAQNSVVDIAVDSPNHTILVSALKAADLVETLQGAGPFTVFAPNNDAFNKLPVGTLDSLSNQSPSLHLLKF